MNTHHQEWQIRFRLNHTHECIQKLNFNNKNKNIQIKPINIEFFVIISVLKSQNIQKTWTKIFVCLEVWGRFSSKPKLALMLPISPFGRFMFLWKIKKLINRYYDLFLTLQDIFFQTNFFVSN